MPDRPLNPKQLRFVEEYLVDFNATAAARRAGYSDRTAQEQSSRLLSNVMVQAEIQSAREKQSQRTEITADRVLKEMALIAFSDLDQILDFSGEEPRLKPANQIPASAKKALSSVKVKRYLEGKGDDARTVEVTEFKLWSKDAALEKLGKHLGIFKDQVEHSGAGGGPIEFIETIRLTKHDDGNEATERVPDDPGK